MNDIIKLILILSFGGLLLALSNLWLWFKVWRLEKILNCTIKVCIKKIIKTQEEKDEL